MCFVFVIFKNLFLWFLFFGGKKFLKLKWLEGKLEVFNVVIIVYVLGNGIILIFVWWYWLIRWYFGLLISGVFVFEINVMDCFDNNLLINICVFCCLLWLCRVKVLVGILKWVRSLFVWCVFFVVIILIFESILMVCWVILFKLLIGVGIM